MAFKNMKKTLLIFAVISFAIQLFAQENYLYGSFSHDGHTLPYRYLEPQNIKSNKKYPVVLFLHGKNTLSYFSFMGQASVAPTMKLNSSIAQGSF